MNKEEKLNIISDLIKSASQLKDFKNYSNTTLQSEWNQRVLSALKNIFPGDTDKLKAFKSINYSLGIYTNYTTDHDMHEAYAEGINHAIGYLNAWKKEIEMFNPPSTYEVLKALNKSHAHSCFLVHGHNNEVKLEVKDFIDNELDVKTIILHQKANAGKTLIEKFESHTDVDFAVCIWSADDEGKSITATDYQKRARQNVIFETGFFCGKFGREKVIILLEDGVEIPSDFIGIIYISLKDNWKHDLQKEIKSIYKK